MTSNLCDYTNACVLIRGNFTIIGYQATLAPFTKCITKIDGTPIDDAEELDLVMPMHNLMEYSSNNIIQIILKETGKLWFYSKDGATNFNPNNANFDDFKSFKYKAKLFEKAEADGANGVLKNATFDVPLKYFK